MNKTWTFITRLIGVLLIILAIYMYTEDIVYTSKFNMNRGLYQEHKEIFIQYWKVLIIGLIVLFCKEIMRYIDYVKYGPRL